MTEKKKTTERKTANVVNTPKESVRGRPVDARGRTFEGKVIRKFDKRVTIEFERMVPVRKYERYLRSKTKLHARLPESMEKDINIGDLIQIRECRPLSKILHFMVIKKLTKENTPEAKK